MVNNIIMIATAPPSVTVCSAISQDIPGVYTSLTPVISVMYFNLPIPKKTWKYVWINAILMSSSSSIRRTKRTNIWRPWRIRTRCCSGWPISPSPTSIWTISIITRKRTMITWALTTAESLAIWYQYTPISCNLVTEKNIIPQRGKLMGCTMLWVLM